MNSLEKRISQVNAILDLSIEISSTNIIDIFVEYSSHTKGLSIRVMKEGWSEEPTTDLNRTIYIDWPGSEEKLNEVIEYLEEIKEEK